MRPLDRLSSIKVKLGVVIVVGVLVSDVAAVVAVRQGLPLLPAAILAAVLALVFVQVLARGSLTRSLREMALASRAMARGDYSVRVRERGRDEVGELSRAFNGMAAELAETDRQRRDLVANVSHELRTPITALRANLENLVDGVEDGEGGRDRVLRTMLAQTERLGRLVEQLLDLSRLEAGQGDPFDVRPFDVAEVLEQTAREARLHAPDGLALRVAVDGGRAVACGDPERIHQVVANLVENAARYSPVPGEVRLGARRTGDRVRIEVADDGPGIPDGEAERVFERFYRADASRAANGSGAGLGLAIARWIVDLHGGAIRVERPDGRGCRMVVELPAA
jgi:signal transduction histidine kinase